MSIAPPQSLSESVRQGRRFWLSPAGEGLWRAERACLGPHCETYRGAVGLQLGMSSIMRDMCPVRHSLDWAPSAELVETPNTLVCLPDCLPLADESVDLTVVHHLLEALASPHHALREAARVTRSDGRLLIFGWHPFGAAAKVASRRQMPWQQPWRTPRRLGDWLAFVDFEIERVDYCGFSWPGRAPRNARLESWGRQHNLPVGQAYMLMARRRSLPVQPIRLRQPLLKSSRSNAWLGVSRQDLKARQRPLEKSAPVRETFMNPVRADVLQDAKCAARAPDISTSAQCRENAARVQESHQTKPDIKSFQLKPDIKSLQLKSHEEPLAPAQ